MREQKKGTPKKSETTKCMLEEKSAKYLLGSMLAAGHYKNNDFEKEILELAYNVRYLLAYYDVKENNNVVLDSSTSELLRCRYQKIEELTKKYMLNLHLNLVGQLRSSQLNA